MFRFPIIATLLFILFSLSHSKTSPPLEIVVWRLFEKFSNPQEPKRLRVEFYNNSPKYVTFLKWNTPLGYPRALESSGFISLKRSDCLPERNRDGSCKPGSWNDTLTYMGCSAYYDEPVATSYQRIPPLGMMKTDIDISNAFDFSKPGFYQLTFNITIPDLIQHLDTRFRVKNRTTSDFTPSSPIQSNIVKFEILQEGSNASTPTNESSNVNSKPHLTCQPTQIQTIIEDFQNAFKLIKEDHDLKVYDNLEQRILSNQFKFYCDSTMSTDLLAIACPREQSFTFSKKYFTSDYLRKYTIRSLINDLILRDENYETPSELKTSDSKIKESQNDELKKRDSKSKESPKDEL